jgi:hypothetical protein
MSCARNRKRRRGAFFQTTAISFNRLVARTSAFLTADMTFLGKCP